MCAAVRQAVEADRVIAWLYDAPRQAVSPLALDSPAGVDEVPPEWSSIPIAQMPVAVAVLLNGQPADIEDAQDDNRIPPELAADLGMSSARFEPLVAGTVVGMLSIEPAPREPAAELHSLLTMVAAAVARVASMLENDRQSGEAAFLLELTEAATRAPSLEEMLIVVCERMARQLGARRATVLLQEDGRLVARACRHADGTRDIAEWDAIRQMHNQPAAAKAALDSGEPVIASGAGSPLIGAWPASSFEVQSMLAVPLGDPPIGVIVLDDSRPEAFSAEQARLAAAAAEHVAPIIEQARTSDERSWHLRAATAIRSLLEEGARATAVEEAGEILARVTREAVGAESAMLLLRDEEDRVVHALTVGADGEFEAALRRFVGDVPADDFRAWRIAAKQPKPIFVENARASRLLPPDMVEALDLKSYIVVPLVAATRPLGLVICAHSQMHRSWSNEERRLVDQLALEGSLIVENAALRATEQQRMEELSHQAFHDSLTELPNRVLLADRLELALARTSRRKAAVAVLFLDLDDFKPINDNYGHEAGDRLLVAVAQRIKSCLRPEDTVARLGGDEFTILLEDIVDVRYAIGVAERIEESLQEPFDIDGNRAAVTASIGIAVSTGRESTPADLMRDSDRAMYLAKRKGRARHEVFSEAAAKADPGDRGATAAPEDEPGAAPASATREHADHPPPSEADADQGPQAVATFPARSSADDELAVQELAEEVWIADALVVEEGEGVDLEADKADGDPDEQPEDEADAEREDEADEQPEEDQEADRLEALADADLHDSDGGVAHAEQPTDDDEEKAERADEPAHSIESAEDGAAGLTAARRRRRLRFPPRR